MNPAMTVPDPDEPDLDEHRAMINGKMASVINSAIETIEGRSAREIAEKLAVDIDWDLLTAWLYVNRINFLRVAIDGRLRSLRGQTQYASRGVFGDLARRKANGENINLRDHFKIVYVVDQKHTRKTVGEMTGRDHRFVAENYEATAKRSALLAAFHRAVAKKVGDRKTSEVFTQEEYARMFNSIVKE